MVLVIASVVALVWANSPLSESYFALWHLDFGFDAGPASMHMELHYWINDGLMAIFFFVVGLEVRQEFAHGTAPATGPAPWKLNGTAATSRTSSR